MVGVYYFNFLTFIFYFSYIVPADDDMTIFKKCQEQNIQYIVFSLEFQAKTHNILCHATVWSRDALVHPLLCKGL